MTVFSLPVSDYADNTQTIVLDGVSYSMRLQWNTRDESWQCFLGATGREFKCKFKVVVGFDLLKPFKAYDETPNGKLFVWDNERYFGRVGRDNFGIDKRFEFFYETEDGTVADQLLGE
jgi:hypothetical protein